MKEKDSFEIDVSTAKNMPGVELLPELVRRTKRLVNCDRATVYLLTENRKELTTILAEGTSPIALPADSTSIAGEAVTRGNIINLARASDHPSFNKEIDRRTGYKTRSMLVMPIRTAQISNHNGVVGVVQCINKLGKVDVSGDISSEEALMKMMPTFSTDDETTLQDFCRQIAPLVQNARVKSGAVVKSQALGDNWIVNVSKLAKASTSEIIKTMLDKTREIVGADRASLFLVDRRKKELWSKIADNTPEIRVKLGQGIVGAVATTGKRANIPDAYRDPRFNKKIDMATGYRTRQILCLPIKNQRGQVVGVVQCINKKRGASVFTVDDEEKIDELCFQCASVLELRAIEASQSGDDDATAAVAEETELDDGLAATGDGIAALLHMVRSPRADVQLHSVTALGFACHNEGNRQRVALLGGVPLLLELCTPFPWRQPELLRRSAHTLGHLTLNREAQMDAHQQGGWKSLLLLAKSADAACWYDAIRSLANLAQYEPLRAPLLNTGALALALSFFRHGEADLQSQAVRLLGSLSLCCTESEAYARRFTSVEVVEKLGRAALAATSRTADAKKGSEALPDLCFAYAKLSLLPQFQAWLFGADGVQVLMGFAAYTGAQRSLVRIELARTIAQCIKHRHNQRIVLNMLPSQDPTDPTFHMQTTAQQRLTMLQEKDALATGDEVRRLMDRMLLTKPWDAKVLEHYTAMLEVLTREPSNHDYLLQKPYVSQLVLLATQLRGDGLSLALQGLRHLAQAREAEAVLQQLLKLGVLAALYALCRYPEKQLEGLMTDASMAAQMEVCRLIAALGAEDEVAKTLASYRGAAGPDGEEPDTLLGAFGSLFDSPSPHVLIEACAALEVYAPLHKVAICHARLVARLIALSHSEERDVSVAAGQVLRALSMTVKSVEREGERG